VGNSLCNAATIISTPCAARAATLLKAHLCHACVCVGWIRIYKKYFEQMLFMEFGNSEDADDSTGLISGCSEKGECLIYTEKGDIIGRYVCIYLSLCERACVCLRRAA
jgi:hypothetical protein